MEGRPVTIRLLDPPLHEFVPHTRDEVEELAAHLNVRAEYLQPKIDKLHEANPMLGHRGCRLAVTYPEIYDMQVEAIARAAVDCVKQHIPVEPEIMIPIVVTARELKLLRPNAEAILERVFTEAGVKIPVHIGTMIEVPRAAIRSGHIAQYADFFSFGTNDLTQMTFAFSRDDVASFLPSYLAQHVLDVDPFKSIDEEGVGELMRFAIGEGRRVKPDLKLGICGEHGGDPATIDFCYRSGLSYVSCSPFRVPLARLAGAQAVINNSGTVNVPDKKTRNVKEAQKMAVTKKVAKKPAVKNAKTAKAAKKPAAKTAKAKPGPKPKADKAAKKPAVKTAKAKTAKVKTVKAAKPGPKAKPGRPAGKTAKAKPGPKAKAVKVVKKTAKAKTVKAAKPKAVKPRVVKPRAPKAAPAPVTPSAPDPWSIDTSDNGETF
jgi:pyruvate,orthophosphate dikinase